MKVKEPSAHVISSAVKVLDALRILGEAGESVGLAELKDRLQVSEATAYRVMQTLITTGFAQQAKTGTGYEPTLELVRLGDLVTRRDHLVDAIRDLFKPVNQLFQEPITVAIPDGDHILFVKKLAGPRDPNFTCDVGVRLPMHVGAAARCILAHSSDEFFESYLDRHIQAPESSVSRAQVRADRDFIREKGYSISLDEVDVGISAVGVPILNATGGVLAGVAVANVTARWSADDLSLRAAEMRTAAAAASARLQHLPSELVA